MGIMKEVIKLGDGTQLLKKGVKLMINDQYVFISLFALDILA